MVGPMTITAEQIAELLARAENHNAQASVAGSATLIWDLAEAVKELVAERDKRVADSNEAQREIDDLTAQVEALAAERDDLRAKLTAAEARADKAEAALIERDNDIGILIADVEWLRELFNADLKDEADADFRRMRSDHYARSKARDTLAQE